MIVKDIFEILGDFIEIIKIFCKFDLLRKFPKKDDLLD